MKIKHVMILIAAIASLFAVFASSAVAAMSAATYATAPADILMKDEPIQWKSPPIIDQGRLLIPLREMAEVLDASVSWDQAAQTATIRKWSETIDFTVGKNTASSEKIGQSKLSKLDVSVKLINDRVYVPLRFLAQFYGYSLSVDEDHHVAVHSPLSEIEQDIVYRGDLAQARQFVMNTGLKNAHYAQKPIPYTHEREGFETVFLFPIGEANRFFLISDDQVSFYEVQDDFFVVTWQAHIPVGQADTISLFLDNKVTNATGPRPDIEDDYFFYRTSGLMTYTNITAGKITLDGDITETGVKRRVGDEIVEQSGSLVLMLPGEVRQEAQNGHTH